MNAERRQIEQERLVLRCQAGERDAFEELISAWERRLFLYLRALLPGDDDAGFAENGLQFLSEHLRRRL